MQDILDAREARWHRRQGLTAHYGLPVGTLTLNVPGPDKNPPGAEGAVVMFAARWRANLAAAGLTLVHEERQQGADGPAWHAVVRGDAHALKRCAVAVEEADPSDDRMPHSGLPSTPLLPLFSPLAPLHICRLADADVLNAQGQPVGRAELLLPPRPCLLCERPALVCMREGRHSPQALSALRRHILEVLASLL